MNNRSRPEREALASSGSSALAEEAGIGIRKDEDEHVHTTIILPGDYYVLIDREDVPRVQAAGPWHVLASGYVQRNGQMVNRVRALSQYLHRFLMGCTPGDGFDVDHRNHNLLDNRKQNLRVCTHAVNMQNMQSHGDAGDPAVGVSYDRRFDRWKSERMVDGVRTRKTFRTREEAVAHAEMIRGR